MKQWFQNVRHKTMPPSASASVDPCEIVVLQQWLLQLIVALPRMLEAINDLDASDMGKQLNSDLKRRLAFAFDILPGYLRTFKAWSNTLLTLDIEDLGTALNRSEFAGVNTKVTHSVQLIAKFHISLDGLRKWSSIPKTTTRALVSNSTKQSLRAYRIVQSVVARVEEVHRVLVDKKGVSELSLALKHQQRGIKVYQYFWQTCMDTLHELRVVSKEWDNVHLRLFSRGCGLFEGPMALDLFLR